jgi:uncharacterized spore protein YtfJ
MKAEELLTGVRDALAARTVYADPVERDGVTVIPAAVVRGGGGGGGDVEGNGGGGFGLVGRPVGAYVLKDGDVTWQPARDPARATLGWQLVAALAALVLWSLARRR